ncbi:hypothetical protein RDABS01_015907, partial [Bienertia sinuspersici]
YPFQRNRIEAIYQFGDSISDTGNLIQRALALLGYHMGKLFSTSQLISLFTYEFTILTIYWHLIDAANFFNFTFLDLRLKKDGNFSHGANSIVAGANALNCSTLAKKSIGYCPTGSSLLLQLDWFKSRLQCKEKLGKALIMMEIKKLVHDVVQVIKEAIEEVIDLGAI